MPTFPQHRNIKGKGSSSVDTTNTGAGDQTNNLPAISDLVRISNYLRNNLTLFFFQLGSLVKKRRVE